MLQNLNRQLYKNVSGIYCIKSTVNGKKYFGSSKDLYCRINAHVKDLSRNKHSNKKLQLHFNKYGPSSLDLDIIELCDVENLITRELYFVELNNSIFSGFNIAIPATLNLPEGVAPETIKKMKATSKKNLSINLPKLLLNLEKARASCKKLFDAGVRKKAWNKGLKTPDHVRAKQSAKRKGKFTGKDHPLSRPIIQYTLSGEKVKVWNSAHEIQNITGFYSPNIRKVCSGERTKAHGYKWKYTNT